MSGHGGSATPPEPPSRSRPGIHPLYRRLPRGPHGIGRREVAANQRARIHGSMIALVSRGGYEQVTVREVIALAGVSRRSFYEQFASRDDCFLRTVGAIAAQLLAAARGACTAHPQERGLHVALEALAREACAGPDATRLLLRESLAAGEAGAAVLGDALSAGERLLAGALCPAGGTLPAGVMRALGGALSAEIAAHLSAGEPPDPTRLARDLLSLGAAQRPPGAGATAALTTTLEDRARRIGTAPPRRRRPAQALQERVLASAMQAAARQPLARLGAAQIADGAGIELDSFFTSFGDVDGCLLEAIELCHERLALIAARSHDLGADWPEATRLALAGILSHLSAEPAQARMIALVAHRLDERARARNDDLTVALGRAVRGPSPPTAAPSCAAIAGAVIGLVRRMLLHGMAERLPTLSDHVAYVVLAPAIGAREAIAALQGSSRRA